VNLTLGQVGQKRKRSDRAQVHLFAVSMCKSSRMIAVECRFVQKLHFSPIALLQIFDLLFVM